MRCAKLSVAVLGAVLILLAIPAIAAVPHSTYFDVEDCWLVGPTGDAFALKIYGTTDYIDAAYVEIFTGGGQVKVIGLELVIDREKQEFHKEFTAWVRGIEPEELYAAALRNYRGELVGNPVMNAAPYLDDVCD